MNNRRYAFIAITLLSCLLIAAGVLASSPAIDWAAITSGGGAAAGGEISLDAALGQPITGTSSGGSTSLQAGFFTETEVGSAVYLPLVSR